MHKPSRTTPSVADEYRRWKERERELREFLEAHPRKKHERDPAPQHAGSAPPKRTYGPPKGQTKYGAADEKLFREMARLMTKQAMTRHGAAIALVEKGRVEGAGTPKSKAKRLAARYLLKPTEY
jgi:hypothetical protein